MVLEKRNDWIKTFTKVPTQLYKVQHWIKNFAYTQQDYRVNNKIGIKSLSWTLEIHVFFVARLRRLLSHRTHILQPSFSYITEHYDAFTDA
jgi:hypothetical protein